MLSLPAGRLAIQVLLFHGLECFFSRGTSTLPYSVGVGVSLLHSLCLRSYEREQVGHCVRRHLGDLRPRRHLPGRVRRRQAADRVRHDFRRLLPCFRFVFICVIRM